MADRTWYIRARGKVQGPFNAQQLKTLRARGQLGRFHELSEDRVNWVSASTVAEVFGAEPAAKKEPAKVESAPAAPPSVMWYYADATGQQQGPIPQEQLLQLWQAGSLNGQTRVWRDGLPDWQVITLPSLGLGLPPQQSNVPAGQAAGTASGGGIRMQACPDCGQSVSIRAGRCPHCGCPVSSAASLQVDPEFGVSNTTTGAAGQPSPQWRPVRTGVTLTTIGAFLFAGMLLFSTLMVLMITLVGLGVGTDGLVAGTVAFGLGANVLWLAAIVLEAIGFGFCVGAPRGVGLRGLAITSLVLAVVCLLLDFVRLTVAFAAGVSLVVGGIGKDNLQGAAFAVVLVYVLQLAGYLVFVVYRFTYLFFLRGTALRLRATGLAQTHVYLAIFLGVLVLLGFVVAILLLVGGGEGAVMLAAMILSMILLVLGLAWLIFYVLALLQMRSRLHAAITGGGA